MLSADQRALLTECREFIDNVTDGAWQGRPEWRAVLVSRIATTHASDSEQQEMIGGLRGALTRWLSGKKQP